MNIKRLPQPGKNNLWFQYNACDAVLVFLHGVLSDSRGCWLYEDKKHPEKDCYWPDLIESDRRFNGISIYLAGYYTAPDSGPYEIRNCADEVFAALKRQDIDGHPPVMEKQRITFVCHSMGGIVARYLLETHQQEFREKKVGLVLIASPSYGSTLANSLDNLITFFNHKQSMQLQWGNWILTDLDDRFKNLKEEKQIPGLCGIELYENHFIVHSKWLPIFRRKLVVSKESAGRYFGAAKQLPKTDHFSSCKPGEKADLAHQYLFDFLSGNGLLPIESWSPSLIHMTNEIDNEPVNDIPYDGFQNIFREVVSARRLHETGALQHIVFGNIADGREIPTVIPVGQSFDFRQRGPRSVLASFSNIQVGKQTFFDDIEQRWPAAARPRAAGLGHTKYLGACPRINAYGPLIPGQSYGLDVYEEHTCYLHLDCSAKQSIRRWYDALKRGLAGT